MRKKYIGLISRINNNKYLIFSAFSLLLLCIYNFAKLKMVNYDHLALNNHDFIGHIKRLYEFSVQTQGRASFVGLFTGAIEYLIVQNYWIWTVVYVLSIAIVIGLIVKHLSSNNFMGICAGILSICLYPISLEPISMPTAYAFMLGFGIIMTLLSIYFLVIYNKTDKYKYKFFSLICIILSVFNYETGLVYIPLLIGINLLYLRKFDVKKLLKKSLEFIFIAIFYITIVILIKSIYPGSYEGTKINTEFNFVQIAYTVFFMIIANIPGFFFIYNGSNAYRAPWTFYNDYSNNYLSIQNIISNYISLFLVIQLVLFGYLQYQAAKKIKKSVLLSNIDNQKNIITEVKSSKWKKIFGLLLMIYASIFPYVLPSLTKYSQDQVKARWRLYGISHQYAYCFMIISIVLLFIYFSSVIVNKKGLLFLISFTIFSQFAMVAFTNEKNAEVISYQGERFEQLDLIINEIANVVSDNVYIYCPSLFNGDSPLSIPAFYYTSRFNYKTHKNINVTSNFKDVESKENFYYLRYLYTQDKSNTIFILSKVTRESLELAVYDGYILENSSISSDNATVYCFSKLNSFDLIGRVSEGSTMLKSSTNGVTSNVYVVDNFKIPIVQEKEDSGKPIIIDLRGNNIDLQSIAILPRYQSSNHINELINLQGNQIGYNLDSAQIYKGYYKDKWVDKDCELNIKTNDEGKIIITGYYPNELTGNETGTIYIDGELASKFHIAENNFIIEIDSPKNKIVNLKIESDFDFSAALPDKRKLCFLLSDIQCK